jgi:hypothetical protein
MVWVVMKDAADERLSPVARDDEDKTNPSLARHLIRSVLVTGLARTAENSVPFSVIAWCCS